MMLVILLRALQVAGNQGGTASDARPCVGMSVFFLLTHLTQYREIHLAFAERHECRGTSKLRSISY